MIYALPTFTANIYDRPNVRPKFLHIVFVSIEIIVVIIISTFFFVSKTTLFPNFLCKYPVSRL